ncbi:MAG: type II secretion system protein [Deltaproteobacteria bacterium]|nr:type II secretion system protein [Deltaproteobacteria bacterium]
MSARTLCLSRPRGPSRGFTLLEIIVALAILGTTFTVLLSAHTAAARREAEARRLLTGTSLARELVSRTEVEGLPAFGKDDGDFGEDFPEFKWEREVTDGPLANVFTDLKQVSVRVNWSDGGKPRSTEVVFYYLVKTP